MARVDSKIIEVAVSSNANQTSAGTPTTTNDTTTATTDNNTRPADTGTNNTDRAIGQRQLSTII
jgi:hypothetical protein